MNSIKLIKNILFAIKNNTNEIMQLNEIAYNSY